jgi:ribosomal protein S18 acetylase RimI-like enzyme
MTVNEVASGPAILRGAGDVDSRRIAELFQISSGGVADYIWQLLSSDFPGLSLLDIGERRSGREGENFSYQHCTMADLDGRVAGMLHGFEMPAGSEPEEDPVLRPYAELEIPGSFYVSGVAVYDAYRGSGIGQQLMDAAMKSARLQDLGSLSLISFAQNTGAVSLYQRLGYRIVDSRPVVPHPLINYTGDAVLMSLEIK